MLPAGCWRGSRGEPDEVFGQKMRRLTSFFRPVDMRAGTPIPQRDYPILQVSSAGDGHGMGLSQLRDFSARPRYGPRTCRLLDTRQYT
jgi:hypothetical protein